MRISRASGPAPKSSHAGSAANILRPSEHTGAVDEPSDQDARYTPARPSDGIRSSRYALDRAGALRPRPVVPAAQSVHTPRHAPVAQKRLTGLRRPAPRGYADTFA